MIVFLDKMFVKKKIFFYQFLKIFLFTSFIFLWDVKIGYIDFRYLILFLLLGIFNNLITKNFFDIIFALKNFFIIFFILLVHILLNIFYEQKVFDYNLLLPVLFFSLIFLICEFYYKFIIKNLFNINLLFVLIFIMSFVFNINKPSYDTYFCGGIPFYSSLSTVEFKIFFKNNIFNENSHLGMIAPAVIFYSFFYTLNNNKYFIFFIFFIFFIICLITSSLTLLAGLALCIILFFIFNYKDMKFYLFFFFVLLVLVSMLLLDKQQCSAKLKSLSSHIANHITIDPLIKNTDNKNLDNINLDMPQAKFYNTTIAVYARAATISLNSFLERPLGWGLNRYISSFEYFKVKIPSQIGDNDINLLNTKDGANIFFKLIVEFGIFTFVILFFIFKYFISNKILIEEKFFFISIVVVQLSRGAGYFNGGFLLCMCIILISILTKLKKND
jgi:hypothetical protein